MFKLYPWEWMMREAFGTSLPGAPVQWVEPPWKAILSNKGILPLLWAMFPRHPNLLPAYFEDDDAKDDARRGPMCASRSIRARAAISRWWLTGPRSMPTPDPTAPKGSSGRRLAPLPQFSGNHTVLGSWIAADKPCGLSIREDASPITKNTSRFLPHAIIA